MNEQQIDRTNYDVASISRPGREKRTNYVQDALHIEKEKINAPGKFIKVFSDMFLKREAGAASYR
jgi:hypothetical protein